MTGRGRRRDVRTRLKRRDEPTRMERGDRGAGPIRSERRPAPIADPYRDLDVIDSRAPRFNQVVIGTLALVAVVAGWPWLLGLLALQLVMGLTFGRRYCLPCLAYFELVQPVFGEGQLEDARPPRFANTVGAVFLAAGFLSYVGGLELVGAALGIAVASLALLAGATGLCAGCEAYKLGHLLTGRRFVACPLPPRPETRSEMS